MASSDEKSSCNLGSFGDLSTSDMIRRKSDEFNELEKDHIGPALQCLIGRFSAFEQRLQQLANQLQALIEYEGKEKVQGKCNWTKKLAEASNIHGLKESLTEKNRLLRFAWVLVLLMATACSSYYIYKVIDQYCGDPTATKVRVIRKDKYDYPIMLLCPDTWLDADRAISLGISETDLQYALGFLINYGIHPAPYVIYDLKRAKAEFENWWYNGNGHKFENLTEFFKYIAIDMQSVTVHCSYCDETEHQPYGKVVMNGAVCYNLSLSPIDGKISLSDPEELIVKMPTLSNGFLSREMYWRLIVNPDLNLGMSDMHYVQVYPNRSNTIRLMQHHYKSLPSSNCITVEEARAQNYSQSACVAACFISTGLPCHPYPLIRVDALQKNISKICNTAQVIALTGKPQTENKTEPQILATPVECVEQCPSLCEKWVFDTTVQSHELIPLNEEDKGVTVFNFLNRIRFYGGILSHEEVPTYSFESLVSNVGSQLGLWIGTSVMSLIELGMFMLNYFSKK